MAHPAGLVLRRLLLKRLLSLVVLLIGSVSPLVGVTPGGARTSLPILVTGSENGVLGLSRPSGRGTAAPDATRPPLDTVHPTCVYRPTLIGETRVTGGIWRPAARFGASYFYSCPAADGVVWLDQPPGPLGMGWRDVQMSAVHVGPSERLTLRASAHRVARARSPPSRVCRLSSPPGQRPTTTGATSSPSFVRSSAWVP
jgi:hypothetical protein